MKILRTKNNNPDFIKLVNLLDNELALFDGDEHEFYHEFNGIENIKHVVLIYFQNKLVACGAFKSYNDTTVEVKRMFVCQNFRGQGFSTIMLNELEKWARELNKHRIVLETGKRQVSAVQLYTKKGYKQIENYPPYKGVDNSMCFQKVL